MRLHCMFRQINLYLSGFFHNFVESVIACTSGIVSYASQLAKAIYRERDIRGISIYNMYTEYRQLQHEIETHS